MQLIQAALVWSRLCYTQYTHEAGESSYRNYPTLVSPGEQELAVSRCKSREQEAGAAHRMRREPNDCGPTLPRKRRINRASPASKSAEMCTTDSSMLHHWTPQ